MRPMKKNLYKQLGALVILIFTIIVISLCILLPKALLPIYEKNIYQYLKQPLQLINNEIATNEIENDVAYLYVTKDNDIIFSENFSDIINMSPKQVLKRIDNEYGKFKYLGTTYYYNTSYNKYVSKISITNSTYIEEIRRDVLYAILPILTITLAIIAGLLIFWARRLVVKIEHLKTKIEKMDDENYIDNFNYDTDDELKVLSDAIDEMKNTLQKQEEYKNQMYQNISHDFKTPLTVIKSYIEASEDNMITTDEASKVIKEQVDKLEIKVHSLLYLNKLNYIKDLKIESKDTVDIKPILKSSIEKFKYLKPNIKWLLEINDKKTIYRGTFDMWETIIDNLLNNFIRYAENEIIITIKNEKITFYNDGPNIDSNILNNLFNPYKKGIEGQFGLGLSIIKKTLQLCEYEITVKNEKKGVKFMIK